MPKEFEFQNATQEQKATAWEWLRNCALTGGPGWFNAAVLLEELKRVTEPEAASITWLEDELIAIMQTVAPGMGSSMPDEITYAIMVTAIRRMMEADTDKYEALLERWQKRQRPQKDSE